MAKTRTAKTARAQIKEHVKAVRAENAKAHEARMESCAAAAERTPLTEAEAAKAGDEWINAKDGRRDRYGCVEATTPVHNGKVGLTTTNFHDLEVDVATGKVKYIGISPNRPQVLRLTSPKKMGAARKAKKAAPSPKADSKKVAEKVMAANTRRASGIVNWTPPQGIDPAAAETCALLLIKGTTSREMLNEAGLDDKGRCAVDRSLKRAGYTWERTKNPDAGGDRLAMWIFKRTAPEQATG